MLTLKFRHLFFTSMLFPSEFAFAVYIAYSIVRVYITVCSKHINPTLPGVPGNLFRLGKEIVRPRSPALCMAQKPATDRNVMERCGFGNSPATVRCMINPYRKSERARTRPPRTLYGAGPATDRSGGGGAHRGQFFTSPRRNRCDRGMSRPNF